MNIPQLKESVTAITESNTSVSEKRQAICDYLKQEIDYYHWVGFYFKNGDKAELKLAEFAGEPTQHTIIPFGKGICGQVAISNKNFVVPDVTAQDNYISCGFKVKSEIVIPIFVNGENVGQIDIDSHITNPFSEADEQFLEFVCEKVAQLK
ncbi:MAG: GAF domain-containing protein [Lutibacter sp.]|nr:GAF domain-containing protein [Lutibacter sp.]MDP3947018.1 GAF domain-containing protein [Lutibacter sp.]